MFFISHCNYLHQIVNKKKFFLPIYKIEVLINTGLNQFYFLSH